MVPDPAPFAHAAAGHEDHSGLDPVQGLGLLDRRREVEADRCARPTSEQSAGFLVEGLGVREMDRGGLSCEGTFRVHVDAGELPLAHQFV